MSSGPHFNTTPLVLDCPLVGRGPRPNDRGREPAIRFGGIEGVGVGRGRVVGTFTLEELAGRCGAAIRPDACGSPGNRGNGYFAPSSRYSKQRMRKEPRVAVINPVRAQDSRPLQEAH